MSLIDYINTKGGDSSFAARKILWTYWKPNENYTGTAEQNTELLAVLQRHHDQSPRVEVITQLVSTGDAVKIKVDRDVTLSSFLSQTSFNATAGVEVSIGDAKVGSFVLRATDGTREFVGEVFIWPGADGQLEVQLFEGSITQPSVPEPTDEEKALFAKFTSGITTDLLTDAATTAFPSWLADNVAGLGSTVMVCVVIPGAGCILSGGQAFADYMTAILHRLVDTHPDTTITADDKTKLKAMFDVVNGIFQLVGTDLFSPTKMKKLCGASSAISAVGDVLSDQIETQSTRIMVNLAFQEARKITIVVCKIAPQ